MKIKRSKPTWQLIEGDCLDRMKHLPSGSVHCVVTSPPYWNLRDYQIDGQHGQEATLKEWLTTQVAVFAEVRRILRDDGLCWVNIGDNTVRKQLQGQPWRLAFVLQKSGWYLRMDNLWIKNNPHPEPLSRKRPTTAHEYVFMLSKTSSYFYDAFGSLEQSNANRRSAWKFGVGGAGDEDHYAAFPDALPKICIELSTSQHGCCEVCGAQFERKLELTEVGKSKQGGWFDKEDRASEKSGAGRHYVRGQHNNITWAPADQLRRFVGWQRPCDHRGFGIAPAVVFDPYAGVGTTGKVALSLGRSFVGIELDPKSARKARKNLAVGQSLGGRVSMTDLIAKAQGNYMDELERTLFGVK